MGNTLQKQEESTFFTCQICFESMLSSTMKFNNMNRCVHPFCKDCMIKYIEVKVNNDVADIKCPGLNCEQLLDPLTCRPIMAAKLFDQWCDLLCESAVLRFERCYCPYWYCSALIVNECGGNVKKSKCPNCKRRFCFRCKLPWHPGYGCEESGVRIDINDDIQFGVLAETKKWKRCPHCDSCIELIEGCGNITCRCGTRFCYWCGLKIDENGCGCRRGCDWREWCFYITFLVFLSVLTLIWFSND